MTKEGSGDVRVLSTHIKGITRHINGPSVTLGQFTAVYESLLEIDSILRRTKF
jgi:hypothetical protein